MRKARAGLHDMFKSTYGFLYEQNADVFTSLFDSLTDFYVSGKVNLDAVMKTFYVTLYQRMFQLINRPHHFGSDYWDCVVKHMDTLKPFGDVPAKMSLQVRRSFVAARSFVQSLMAGQEVVNKIMMVSEKTNMCLTAGLFTTGHRHMFASWSFSSFFFMRWETYRTLRWSRA